MVEKKSTNKNSKDNKNGNNHKKIEKVMPKTDNHIKNKSHLENKSHVIKDSNKKEVKSENVGFLKKILIFLKENSTFLLLSVILILSVLTIFAFSTREVCPVIENEDTNYTDEITFYYIRPPTDCSYCSNDFLDMVLATHEQMFVQIKELKVNNIVYEFDSKEAQNLIKDYDLKKAPAVLLEAKSDNLAFKNVEGYADYFELVNDKYKLSDAILSNNGQDILYELDPVEREKIEKASEEAKEKALELMGKSDKPKIDFFVMSFCPYGIQAEVGVLDALELLGSNVDYKPWYIMNSATSNNGRCELIGEKYYCSLHGAEELKENIRQLCIYEDQEDKFLDYIGAIKDLYYLEKVSYSNIDSQWKTIAKSAGVNVANVEECYNDKDRVVNILDDQILVSNVMGVTGSPTIFVDGKLANGGRTGEYYKDTLCNSFKEDEKPAECETGLNDATSGAAGSC